MSVQTRAGSGDRAAIVNWTASIGAVTAEAVAELHGTSVASARAHLGIAVREQLLARARPLAGRPALYTVTRTGLRGAALAGLEPARLTAANANHMIACAHAAAVLQRAYPDHTVIGERELRWSERQAERPIASAVVGRAPNGVALLHRPDLVLTAPASSGRAPIAVEVELTIKAPKRLTAICLAWARCRHVAGVLYLAPDEVRRALERAITATRAAQRIVVVPLEALASGSGDAPNARSVPSGT
jgi:hypothetical protein